MPRNHAGASDSPRDKSNNASEREGARAVKNPFVVRFEPVDHHPHRITVIAERRLREHRAPFLTIAEIDPPT
jgi:hypothetical protein